MQITKYLNSILSSHNKIQYVNTVRKYIDINKSNGHYIFDDKGNKYLDMITNIASLPVGYNHPKLLELFEEPINKSNAIHRYALGVTPPYNYPDIVLDNVMKIKPSQKLSHIHTGCGCGSGAIENAIKLSCIYHQNITRESDYSQLELDTALKNIHPGSPNLKVLSFDGGFHGRTLGALSCTKSKPIHKVDIPSFDWISTDYPTKDISDKECLDKIEDIFNTEQNIAATIIEPIQGEGGDRHASNYFFYNLRELTLAYNISLIVDEVQTGMGLTGKYWACQHWGHEDPADILVFAKKMQISGCYYKEKYNNLQDYQIFNTWMGDYWRSIICKGIINIIEEEKLLDNSIIQGEYLLNSIKKINSDKITNIRGKGLMIAFDLENELIQPFIKGMDDNGVLVSTSGYNTIRLRPCLNITKNDIDFFINALRLNIDNICI